MSFKIIQLKVLYDYDERPIVNKYTPKDIALILTYGENILNSCTKTIENKIINNKIKNLNNDLNAKNAQINDLKDQINKLWNNAKEATKIEYENYCNTLKQQNNILQKEKVKYVEIIKTVEKEQLNKIENINKQYIETLKDERQNNKNTIESIKTNCQMTINELKKIIIDLKQNNINIKKDKEIHYHELLKKEKNNYERIINNNDITKNQIDKLIKTYGLFFNYQNNTDKGKSGENLVEVFLKEEYTSSYVKNVSKENGEGDLIFIYNNLVCLIEIKRVKNIQKERDINKFIRDVRNPNNNINSALFISIESKNIPNKGSYYYENNNDIHTYYVYFTPDNIKCAIEELKYKVSKNTNNKNKEQKTNALHDDTKVIINSNLCFLNKEKEENNKNIKTFQNMVCSIEQRQLIINDAIAKIYNYYINYTDMEDKNNKIVTSILTDKELDKLVEWYNNNKRMPKFNETYNILEYSLHEWRQKKIKQKEITDTLKSKIKKKIKQKEIIHTPINKIKKEKDDEKKNNKKRNYIHTEK